jgi:glycosyltransferase involved in cell wall biosynthesis
MRLGVVWEPCQNAYYRAMDPMKAMVRRGHQVLWPSGQGAVPHPAVDQCDVVHVYWRADDVTQRLVAKLVAAGVAVTFDNDDDFTATPKESPEYKDFGGLKGQRYFAASARIAQAAAVCTTTCDLLAEKYRGAGARRVEVIPNQLGLDVARPTPGHAGVVVGWVAALEHRADVARIKIVDALERILADHPEVRVECIGINLGLSQRYRHDPGVEFLDLPRRIGAWDVGIAPLADIPLNRARSDIKLKEYAASGVPWLASPIGPYAGLGEDQGGRLVPDDGWFEALDRLVASRRDRKRLGRKGRKWAKGQTIEATAGRWEAVFAEAAASRGSGAAAATASR